MKIARIEEVGKADVYNMEVETTHDFAVNNGVIVHNCYDEQRYAFMDYPIAPRANEKTKIDFNDPLNQRTNGEHRFNNYLNI